MKKILVVGDTHCGSEVGLMPSEYEVHSESKDISYTIKANKTQEALYNIWTDMVDDMGRRDLVICMGDMVDGRAYKTGNTGVISADVSVQEDIATTLLKEIKARKYIGCAGSRYHSGSNPDSDKNIILNIAREYHEKQVFGNELIYSVDDVNFHIRHTTNYSKSPALRENAARRDLIEFLDEAKNLEKRIDIALRAHIHTFVKVDWRPYLTLVSTGCFKWRDDYITARTLNTPDVGYLEININNGEYEIIPHMSKLKL